MRDPDAPAPDPVLNANAKHYERQLHKIFAVDTASIWLTWNDWKTAETQVTDLAKAVRTTKASLQEPSGDKPWSGPAADAAYTSLDRLSTSLDDRSRELGDVKASLDKIYKAVNLAKDEFSSKVNSISTWVDPAAHQKLPAGAPKPDINLYGVPDGEAIAAAEDAKWEERNQAAKVVLDSLGADTQTASAKLPIDAKSDAQTPYSNDGPASSDRTSGTASQSSTSGGYINGGRAVVTGQLDPVDNGNHTGTEVPTAHPQPPTEICTGDPTHVPTVDEVNYDPISSDGPVTGSTGVSTGTGTGPTGTYPTGGGGGGGVGGGGLAAGGIGGAAGLGGMLRGGAGGMFSNGGAARGGATGARGNGAGARGSATRAGGVGRPGGAQAIPGGGGASARGGASGRGSAVKGATGSGRYGVPKLGSNGGVAGGGGQAGKGSGAGKGAGTAKAGARGGGRTSLGAAGAGGARKGDKNGQPEDVDKLTTEDEEKWFEGTDDSSPQVWE
ncbi:hypothetical protein ACOCJ7_18395 [Knoellia sp. CPCC 206453]|uniref:hypothetical protein n=1 Tax=Knoellia pratensis TaxID=3404796 RepID=UPI00361ECF45